MHQFFITITGEDSSGREEEGNWNNQSVLQIFFPNLYETFPFSASLKRRNVLSDQSSAYG